MVTTAQPATAQHSTFNPLTTWDGWQQFVDTPVAPARDADDQGWTMEQREDYHARFVVLKTPAMDAISAAVRRLLLLNRGQQGGARRGLIISGPATTGKTTAMQQLGRTVELADRRRHPGCDGRLPVLFITVPPSSTPKMLISEFARFLGLPALERMNQIQITNAVCELLCEMGTQLVLVDDVHLMDTRSRAGAETSDQLKYLGERIPATFVYSGIDVETSPLLTGVRGSQLAGRFKIVRNQPLRYGSPADKQIWHDLVHGMASALRLRHYRLGTLVTHAAYLHARTGGRMGSLSHLIREAALVSLMDGTEKITKKLLEQIELDTAAEQRSRAPQRHRVPSPRRG
ncbi:TniB family NTP-binding protein [Streptomyces sp. NPDC005479]|uniref:TniB family NTP-binding protein n=1 Tax=unclassified Streptomyces TaxID=2593676 RepID=UPI0033A4A4BC